MKLEKYGVRGEALKWFACYLSDRSQSVVINNTISTSKPIVCGVPQGSVLGPLLFLVYVNDLVQVSDKAKFILFADDTNVIYHDKNLSTLIDSVNTDLEEISKWFNHNKLSINTEKTKFMIFSETGKIDGRIEIPHVNIILNDRTISNASDIKFLGVTIQSNLKWDKHCENIAKKIVQAVSAMSRLKYSLPSSALLTIYRSLIETHLNYSILAWGNAPKKTTQRLVTLQKRAIRLIVKAKYNSHTEPLFRNLKILKFEDLAKLNTIKLGWKALNRKLPQYHSEQLPLNTDFLNISRATRQQNNIHVFPITKQIEKSLINHSVGTSWNSLSNELKDKYMMSYKTFINHVKESYLSMYTFVCENQLCYVCSNN
jgi:hypothetical protein